MPAARKRLREAAKELDLGVPEHLAVRTARDAAKRDPKAATAALYFGGNPTADEGLLAILENEKIPVIPVASAGANIPTIIPATLHATNAFFIPAGDNRLEGAIAALLECVGLLHQQRRVFVSYRRDDSREVAVQLHDTLSGRGFDVFLDTHDIRPGLPLQDMLWHRMADSDIVIMLDTEDYFGSKWTVQEFGRALSKGIFILRVVWPGHNPSRHLSLGEVINLLPGDFTAAKQLSPELIEQVVERAERLRSRSIANRHRQIAGKLSLEVERIGGTVNGIGAHRAISVTLPSGKQLWAYPAVGIPTAELLNDVHSKAEAAGQDGFPVVVYDHIGIRKPWLEHLGWLDTHIGAVRALKIMDASWELVQWDS